MSHPALDDSQKVLREQCLHVIRYWHRLEFFTPFNLDDALSRGELAIDLSLSTLEGDKACQFLPWLLSSDPLFHYQLYLLPFDKKELTSLSTRYFPLEFQQQNAIELEETLDDEGLTCFARLFIDKNGRPQWTGFSISTLPWAMGMLQSGDFDKLSELSYNYDLELLKSSLRILENQCEANDNQQIDPRVLLGLLKALCQWARFSPDYPFVLKIKPIPAKQESLEPKAFPINTLVAVDVTNPQPEEVSEEIDDSLDILNSFFIQDLEKTINHLANDTHPLLEFYINGCTAKKDILNIENQSFLLEQLQPHRMNSGRWPSSNQNMMSLMQQLCINQCFNVTHPQPILATNGPPGTGKTTLLKDIIAENIVCRAKKLADFATVDACFIDKKRIAIGDKKAFIHCLHPDLTGFEMLVVSSNNTAVENITRELPLKKGISELFQNSCHYLQPLAAKIAAKHHNQSVLPLPTAAKPWGLIAVALGKSGNRQEFVERFFFSPDNNAKRHARVMQGEYLNIWEWRNQYKGKNFTQAKTIFLEAWSKVEKYKNKMQELANLHEKILNDNFGKERVNLQQLMSSLEQEKLCLANDKRQTEKLMQETEAYLTTLHREIHVQLDCKPSFWKRIIRSQEAKSFNEIMQNLQSRRLQFTKDLLQLQNKIVELNQGILTNQVKLTKVTEDINSTIQQENETKTNYLRLKSKFPEVNLPGVLISENDQISCYWQTEEFNQLRAQLFISALQLHEAWLAEALRRKYFGGNLFAINYLLDGNHPLDKSYELIIWQSLFMMIPVVSSTFASIANQFKNLRAHSLGWLLIDEAGQAIPQAAIGALWRSRRTIVVGDPRQIEPIMTIPPHLIEGIAKHHFSSDSSNWLPHITSVQKLADQACFLGSMMQQNQQQEWIGIPLLVHRRCLDPMFSIANEIAYENKMINARFISEHNSLKLPESTWFDVSGIAVDNHFVLEQGSCLLRLFIWFYNHDQELPRLFIITPFKKVRKQLKNLIQNQENWLTQVDPKIPLPPKEVLRRWVNSNIGTVHTFQGKECEKVIFVLGADKENKGAIRWASSKPNLLNVALTRATERIYIIGEWELWSNKRYFSQASAALGRKKWEPC